MPVLLINFHVPMNDARWTLLKDALPGSLKDADRVFCYGANLGWDAAAALAPLGDKAQTCDDLADLVRRIVDVAQSGDHILVMSNGGFGGIHQKLLDALGVQAAR